MSRRHGWWALVAMALVAPAACKRTSPPAAPAVAEIPADAVRLLVVYGSEKKTWLEEQVRAFAATSPRTLGHPVAVELRAMGSGEAMQGILRGDLRPQVLSPASAAYLALLNDAWKQKTGRNKDLAAAGEPLLLSPIVIALWRPMAEALGHPDRRIGWKELLAVARDPRGWGQLGHPEWGSFKLGHTHPELSNSGLLAVLAAAYAGAGKTRGLTAGDVGTPAVKSFLGAVEQNIVHYGTSTGFFAERMVARGPAYLSAAVLYENLVVESYGKPGPSGMPVVAIYPREGTFWADHPYAVLDGEWVSPAQRQAAGQLLAFLRARPAQERALALGFRPADPSIATGPPIDAAHGVDPRQPQTLLELPDAATLNRLLQVWREEKRPADVVLVFDKSGSMNGQPLAEAKRGARAFIDRLQPEDQVTLVFFDHQVHPAFGPVTVARGKADLLGRIDGAFAEGGTALYEATRAAYDLVAARVRADPRRTHAVVVMTDGLDESSQINLEAVKTRVRAEGDQPVRVFTIAYGERASDEVLKQIAEAAQGMSSRGTLANIVQVYDEMAAFF